jgi:hypothetical protein
MGDPLLLNRQDAKNANEFNRHKSHESHKSHVFLGVLGVLEVYSKLLLLRASIVAQRVLCAAHFSKLPAVNDSLNRYPYLVILRCQFLLHLSQQWFIRKLHGAA